LCSCLAVALGLVSSPGFAKEIVHDAEHYVLLKQYKDKWARQDQELQAKLDELREKHGKPPNIIHIMWDDTPVGEIGIPEIQKVRGCETPNMNQIAREGINFMRMYTEPSCTPSRAAVMTGVTRCDMACITWVSLTRMAVSPLMKSPLPKSSVKPDTPPHSMAKPTWEMLNQAT
jgi:hypothetical protein